MKAAEKIIKTPIGAVSVRVKKGMSSYQNSPFIIKKIEEAERSLAGLKVVLTQE